MRQLTLLEALADHGVDFVLVGGMAAVAHGSSQVTRDLDICVPLDAGNFLRIQKALRAFHPRVRAGSERLPLELDLAGAARLKNLYILSDEGNLDCLGDVMGIGGFEAACAESLQLEISGRPCRVLTLEALIRAKEALGRPRDLLTATELRAIRERTRGKA